MKILSRLAAVAAAVVAVLALAVPAGATPVAVGGGWHFFTWGGDAVVDDNPFTFSWPSKVTLTVTDAFCAGDVFGVLDSASIFGNVVPIPVGQTSWVPADLGCSPSVGDPDAALADPRYSHGVFSLGAGSHSLELMAAASPFGGGGAFLRVDPAPLGPRR